MYGCVFVFKVSCEITKLFNPIKQFILMYLYSDYICNRIFITNTIVTMYLAKYILRKMKHLQH